MQGGGDRFESDRLHQFRNIVDTKEQILFPSNSPDFDQLEVKVGEEIHTGTGPSYIVTRISGHGIFGRVIEETD